MGAERPREKTFPQGFCLAGTGTSPPIGIVYGMTSFEIVAAVVAVYSALFFANSLEGRSAGANPRTGLDG